MHRKEHFRRVKRIVVKIGSSSITDGGTVSSDKLRVFIRDVAALLKKDYQIIVVTSGAISSGAGLVGLKREKMTMPKKQAMAAVGQTILMNEYRALFHHEGFNIGQILLTEEDFKNRTRYLNIRNTLNELLELSIVPVVNENDTVTTKEIKVGDNDTLSAYVANIADADLLILLTDIDGFYYNLKDPSPVDMITKIDDAVIGAAGGSGSIHGTGGMMTKIRAADMLMKSGKMTVIAPSSSPQVIARVVAGEHLGTLFTAHQEKLKGKKRWISFNMSIKGKLLVDDGARKALVQGKKSLLSSGITGALGKFSAGDGVEIADQSGVVFAKGITNYSSDEILLVKGKKSAEIMKLMGESFYEEAVHRDNLILL